MSAAMNAPETPHMPNADEMARQRTIMAADRTLMAWVRTTLSMISFGFTIYKFLQAIYESGRTDVVRHPEGPRNFGLSLILLGLLALAIACVQYWYELKRLCPGRRPFPLTLVVAGFVALFGIGALMNVLFHLGPF
jgi:putative membrane protein